MAALTTDTTRRYKDDGLGPQSIPVAADAVIFKGAIVAVDADGYLVAASDTAGLKVAGIACEAFDNTGGADGDGFVVVQQGRVKVNTTGANAIVQADLYTNAVILDDDTVVQAAGATNDIVAGKVVEVESDGVWVNFAGAF